MRVLHVVPYFPPDRVGGVGEVAAHLHRGLLAAGHDSQVATGGTNKDDPTVRRIATSAGGFVTRVAGLARWTRQFDLVHVHAGESLALALAMRLTGSRTPILTTYHVGYGEIAEAFRPFRIEDRSFGREWSVWRYRHLTCPVHRWVDRWMLSLTTDASFISRSSAIDILGPTRAADARVIYNALPEPSHSDDRGETAKIDLLFVGTSSLRKRLELLPFVLRDVRQEHDDTTMGIVGVTVAQRPDISALFQELGQANHVRWIGRLRSEEILPYYRNAAVLLVPSACEGLPMVILEAQQCGTPCVATAVSGHPEILENGVNGFLVDRDDPAQMADRALRILNDPAAGKRMGETGRRVVQERFGLERQLAEYLDLYRSMIQRSQNSSKSKTAV